MGIHGIYQEIGPGRRVALSKLAAEHYITHSRPFRLAIDISIWLFQIQSGKGGSNPALRTFYYRLLRLLSLNIHPLFVFDGQNKPAFKRNKKVGGPNVRVSSIPEFLAKQLLKHFGFPFHYAPGEAEAECALLQREGLVDAVLSEDVDTLMFGSGMTLRSWTPEQKSSKTPTHVNVYEAEKTKETSGLDREGMILIAMMSGGDYITEGIPGCGPKLACEAARAGFGRDLCSLDKKDTRAMDDWRERLRHEIRTNESKFFRQRRPGLNIPDTFPSLEVLGYYTHPCISGLDRIAKLRNSLKWDLPLDYPSLREFAADAFDWRFVGGAKKFIRNLAPAILVRELRMRGEATDDRNSTLSDQEENEAALINAIHGKRTHPTTDNTPELRISFTPIQLVNIDLSIEEPDEEVPEDDDDSDSEPLPTQDLGDEDGECPASPKKKRAPSKYDPTVHEKVWLLDMFVRLGAPLKVQDWEASAGALKARATKPRKNDKKSGGMNRGAIDRFTKVMKPGVERPPRKKSPEVDELDLTGIEALAKERSTTSIITGDASRSRPVISEMDLTRQTGGERKQSSKRPSPETTSPPRRSARPRMISPTRKTSAPAEVIEILSSSPAKPALVRKTTPPPPDIRQHFRRCSTVDGDTQDHEPEVSLPDTVTRRRKRSPLKRHRTAPVAGDDADMMSPVPGPSTPKPVAIEAIDLASPGSLPSLPRFGLFRNLGKDTNQTRPMNAAEDVQSPDVIPGLAKSRAASPIELTDGLDRRGGIDAIQLSSSMPTPPQEEDEDIIFTKQTVSASALLPFNKRLRDRVPESSSSRITVVTPGSVKAQDTATSGQRSLAKKVTKRFIQPRDSLPGTWKEIELEVDLTEAVPANHRRYRKSGVEEVDLTDV